jgi:putative CocE/NonD family hydrolase
LTLQPPPSEAAEDRYPVDFEASTGPFNRWWEMGAVGMKTVMYGDRRRADERLLTYSSEPIEDDLEITGHPIVTLYLTATGPDAAIHAYLEEVDPSGRVTYLTEGQLRASCRLLSDAAPPYTLTVPYHTFRREDARPMIPGEVAELTFGLLPTSVLVRKGHRIRVAIAGHDKGTFVRIPREGDLVLGVQRSASYPSSILLPARRRKS